MRASTSMEGGFHLPQGRMSPPIREDFLEETDLVLGGTWMKEGRCIRRRNCMCKSRAVGRGGVKVRLLSCGLRLV